MPELSVKKARSILKEGKKDHGGDYATVYEGDIPDDEKKLIEEADEVVELAEQARDAGQDHPAIEKILFLADVDGDSDSNPNATEEPWEGYDEEKVGKIVRELSGLDDDELGTVFEYERENKNREPVIEALEEIAAERGLDTDTAGSADGEPEEEEEGDYKPWGKYDEDSVKSIIGQIKGLNLQGVKPAKQIVHYRNILEYEEENEDRPRIKSEIEGKIEQIEEEGADVAEEPEDQESGEEEGLTRQDIEEMDFDGLRECLEFNEVDPDEVFDADDELNTARVKTAAYFELDWSEGDESEESTEEHASGQPTDYLWADLESYDLDDLKEIIKEKELGFRAGKKTDLDSLREKIADALDIQKPAQAPWRGYDSREAKQIIKKLSKLDEDELRAVFDYESENQARKSILKKLEEIAEERGVSDGGGYEEEEEPQDEETPESEIDEAEEHDEVQSDSRKRRRKGKASFGKKSGGDDAPEDDGEEPDYENLIDHITDQVEQEHFAVPRPLPETVSDLPFDLTELSEREVRQLYSANLSYFGRASYLAKLEKQLSIACKHIADAAFDDAIAGLSKIDEETEKEKSATQLKAEAERSPKVRRWRRRQQKHESLKESMRADAEIYRQNLESLSREWTMRTEEIDHSGGLGPRGKAGAKAASRKTDGGKAKPRGKGKGKAAGKKAR